jgi:hypothetical protein
MNQQNTTGIAFKVCTHGSNLTLFCKSVLCRSLITPANPLGLFFAFVQNSGDILAVLAAKGQ